jgi:RNA polymerase sigma factor (sigma-70 family)
MSGGRHCAGLVYAGPADLNCLHVAGVYRDMVRNDRASPRSERQTDRPARIVRPPGVAPEGPSAAGSVCWQSLFDRFFSPDPDEASGAAATFARMIRFWMIRAGVRDGEVSSDDLVQDVLLELTRSRAHIADPRALGAWLRITTLRKIRDRWRASRRAPTWQSGELESLPAPTLLPDEQVLRKQDHSDLLEAIDRLPPALRECIQLQLRGLSEPEIARKLEAGRREGSPVQLHTVKNWLRKARSVLRHSLLEKHA